MQNKLFLSGNIHAENTQLASYATLQKSLRKWLERHGATIHYVPPIKDISFIDIGGHYLIHQNQFLNLKRIKPNFASVFIEAQLTQHGLEPSKNLTHQHDGASARDVFIVDNTAYIVQFKTSFAQMHAIIKNNWNLRCLEFTQITEANDPYRYLLPLSETEALCYLPAFDASSQQKIQDEFTVINVSHEETIQGAMGALVINNHVLLPHNCDETAFALTQHGYQPTGLEGCTIQNGISCTPRDLVLAFA